MASDGLSPRQRRAIAALAAGESVADAATTAGVSDRTMARWGADPAFREALADAGREQIAAASRLMIARLDNAIGVIGSLMTDDTAPAHVRLRAAQICVERAPALYDAADTRELLGRIETLMTLIAGIVAGDQDQ